MGGAKLLAGVNTPSGPPQPFAIEEMGTGKLDPHTSATQPFDRFLIILFGGIVLAEQCMRTGLDAEGPVRAAGLGGLGESPECCSSNLSSIASRCRFDQLG